MKSKQQRKQNDPVPELKGWNYTDLKHNMNIRCRDCGRIVKQFFYRFIQRIDPPIGVTESVCLRCVPWIDCVKKNGGQKCLIDQHEMTEK